MIIIVIPAITVHKSSRFHGLLVISSGYKVISISCEGGAAGRDWWCTKGKGKVDRCLTPSITCSTSQLTGTSFWLYNKAKVLVKHVWRSLFWRVTSPVIQAALHAWYHLQGTLFFYIHFSIANRFLVLVFFSYFVNLFCNGRAVTIARIMKQVPLCGYSQRSEVVYRYRWRVIWPLDNMSLFIVSP